MKNYLVFFLFALLFGCKPAEKVLEAMTGQILEPVSMRFEGELGEIAVGDAPIPLTMTIKNNSSESITDMKLDIGTFLSMFNYTPDSSGSSISPGYGGTCAEKLESKQSCTYTFLFNPRKTGLYNIPIIFSYKNLIQAETKTTALSVLTGEPATLVFTNDISKYDFGVLEQTETIEREVELEIKNMGGLSARDIIYPLSNGDPTQPSFRIISNECTKVLKPSKTCKIKIGYKSFNNNYSDPEVKYSSKLGISYRKDNSGKIDKLNAFFNFTSSTIEAKFATNYKTVDFGQVVAGNNVKRSIKISNNGYNIGSLKKINFHKFDGSLYASCVQGTTEVLNCGQTLVNFPFIIEDKSNCFAKDVKGVEGATLGESCYFDITYWPSKSYAPGSQPLHDFDQGTLAFVYDSHWLNKENIVTKAGLFDITATFSSAGKMQLESISIESTTLPAGKITTADTLLYVADLGRLAKTSDSSLTTFMKVTLRNVGESPVSLVSLQDGASTPHLITETGYDLNSYYKGIKHNSCAYLAPGATCNFNFSLSPVVQGTTAQEDALMYDNTSDALKKYKKFSYTYSNGSTLEDNGSAVIDSKLEIRLISKLIAKGMLAFTDSLSQTIPVVLSGASYTKIINLKNVGTGDIYAISHHATNNLFPGSFSQTYPYRIIPVGTPPLPATKDCKDLLYGIGSPNTSIDTPNSAKFLAPGQSCALAFEVAAANTARMLSAEYLATNQHERPFAQGLNGTTELWRRKQYNFSNTTLTFNYYDGDANPDDLTSKPFGYLNKTKDMTIASSFNQPPYIGVYDPSPTASGILARPALNYPVVSQTYPTTNSLSAYNIAETYFNATYFNGGTSTIFHSSASTDQHVKNMGIVGNTIIFHMGTFKVGTVNYADFKFGNNGGTTAPNSTIAEETSAGNPISLYSFNNLTAKPFPALIISNGQRVPVRLKFAPTAAGTFKRCYDLSYDNRIGGVWVQTVCAYAEAIASAPLLKVQYQDIDVAYDSLTGTVTQTPTGVWTDVTSPVNVPMNSPLFGPDGSSKIAFTAVKGSAAYALKLIRITNIGTTSATKVNYAFASAPNTPYALPSEITTSNATGANPTCSTNMTLAVNGACELYIKYKPINTSASIVSPYLGLAYDMASNLGQFASQLTTMQFNALDPAKLVVTISGVSSESVTDWSNPAIPIPQSLSWPININNYSASNTHLITTTMPTTRVITNIPLTNSSALKASFLSMNSNPGAGTWNTIFSNSNVVIAANRACFYGDDEFNAAVPSTEKGFNATSTNKCYLQVSFSGDFTFQNCSTYNAPVKTKKVIIGGRIQATCNPFVYTLNFYNYKRLSTEKIILHIKGFIEANRTTADTTKFTNVSATSVSGSTGSATFTWPSMTPQNPSYGSIVKYRIYYSTNYSDLRTDNMFYVFTTSPVLSYFETSNASINTATINNLTQGKYYFFRVVPIRSYTHPIHGVINYVSMTPNLEILTLPIPNLTATYNHTNRVLIDKSVLSATGSQTAGATACAAKKYDLSILGVAKSRTKLLINSTIFSLIRDNPALSSGYPGNDVGTIPHWLADAAYNLRTSINLYNGTTLAGFTNFDTTKLTGNDLANKAIYSKSCNNSSTCDLLYKVVGGDDVDLYYNGTYFTTPTGIAAYHRCYAVILCPTNASKTITDPTCAAP